MKAIHVLAALLLQKQNEHSKAKDLVVALERKLELCENGNIIELLNRGEANQERLRTSRDLKTSQKFLLSSKPMQKGNVNGALKFLTNKMTNGILPLCKIFYLNLK